MAIVPPMGFAASPESATVPESSDYPLVTLLEPLIGGNTRLVMIMDVEVGGSDAIISHTARVGHFFTLQERKPTCDLLNGLALGEAFRKLKTKQYLNSFDERVAVLWKMEEKYKLLRVCIVMSCRI